LILYNASASRLVYIGVTAMTRSRLIALVFSALASANVLTAQPTQPGHYGIFSGSSSVGVGFPGSVTFDFYTGIFKVTGGGADMWGTTDAFHLGWVKLQGDYAISADIEFPDKVPSPLAKAVLIFRQSLDPGSAYADVAIHADGHITLQYREKTGGETADVTSPLHNSKRIRIERRGDVFTASAQAEDGKMIPFSTYTVPMNGPVFVGIGACPHDVKNIVTIRFSNVVIDRLGN
jgi:TolB protein